MPCMYINIDGQPLDADAEMHIYHISGKVSRGIWDNCHAQKGPKHRCFDEFVLLIYVPVFHLF